VKRSETGASAKARRRNVLVIMSDTFRRDHISAYGDRIPWSLLTRHDVITPNLDRLAREGALFDRFYSGSFPTVPARTDLFVGRTVFPSRGWQPLEDDDLILPDILSEHGWTSQIIFDTPMLAHANFNFHRGFTGWDFVRGQHADAFVTAPLPVTLPAGSRKLMSVEGTERYLRNTSRRQGEADWMCAKTVSHANEWLEDNRDLDGFLLWVDMWDPHEPFDAPDFDLRKFVPPGYSGQKPIYPAYGRADYLAPDELDFIRGSYAALVTLVDRWVGKLLDKLDTVGLAKDTLVVFLTDHGYCFGDYGLQGKPTGVLGKLYEPLIRSPLIVRHPDGLGAATRPKGIVQHADILPTILDYLGIAVPERVTGRSVLPLLAAPDVGGREFAFSGRHSRALGGGWFPANARRFNGFSGVEIELEPLTVTTEEWSLILSAHAPAELYRLSDDPRQRVNLAARSPEVVRRLTDALVVFMTDGGAPADKIAQYRAAGYGDPAPPASAFRPDAQFFVVTEASGRRISFASADDARRALSDADVVSREVESTTLTDLLAENPRSLVSISGTYYYATDLLSASETVCRGGYPGRPPDVGTSLENVAPNP
jgi:arylsulfatase A-like enzyme